MIQELKSAYHTIFEQDLLHEIVQVGTFKEISEGFQLIDIGDYIRGMPLLISGAIKILRNDQNGDELLLYYLEKGDTCSVTLACCFGTAKSEIRAVAALDTKLIMVPAQKMEEWITNYSSWRNFIFNSYHVRLNEMLQTIDSIAFNKMDVRLVDYLKEKSRINNSTIIQNTHQEIAYDLHSSRVVISRLLKKLEQLKKIELHRNHIKLLDL